MGEETERGTPAAAAAVKPGLRGWVKGVFILSLTLNFLVAGLVVGGLIGHARHPPPLPGDGGGTPEAFSLGPLSGAFSREDRLAMRRAAEGQGTDFRAMRAAIGSDFAQLEAALSTDPYDEGAVRAVLAEMRARTLMRMDLGEQAMLDRLRAMSPADRAAMVQRLRDGYARLSRHIDDDGDHGRPTGGYGAPRP